MTLKRRFDAVGVAKRVQAVSFLAAGIVSASIFSLNTAAYGEDHQTRLGSDPVITHAVHSKSGDPATDDAKDDEKLSDLLPLDDVAPGEFEAIEDPVAVSLDQLFAQKDELTFASRKERNNVRAFYKDRDFMPLWFDGGVLTQRARLAIERVEASATDGLNDADYVFPAGDELDYRINDFDDLARAEIAITKVLIKFARHVQVGRVKPSALSYLVTMKPDVPHVAGILSKLSDEDVVEALNSFEPPHEAYQLLKAHLHKLRNRTGEEEVLPTVSPERRVLKKGMRDRAVVTLRERLDLVVPEVDADLYDDDVLAAVKAFQAENRLGTDGVLGPKSLAVLNRPARDPLSDVIVNMEQWRWMPRDLGAFHVRVNIPEYLARVHEGEKSVYETRVVVGKFKHQTPVFSDAMDHVIVNPYWNVPQSIAYNEMLSKIRRNPSGFFQSGNYEVLSVARRGVRSQVLNPETVNWNRVDFDYVRIRQRPGGKNALGSVKFMFPNKHAVYLHDTPSKSLFKRSSRAFSHGCVRVHQPMKFASALLENESWGAGRLKALLGGREQQLNLKRNIPVHLNYFTASVNEDGDLVLHDDIYRHHSHLKHLLDLPGGQAFVRPIKKPIAAKERIKDAAKLRKAKKKKRRNWAMQLVER